MATRPPLPHHGSHPGPVNHRHHLSRLNVPQSISVAPGYFAEQALFTPGPNTAMAGQASFMAHNFPHGPQTAFLMNTPGPGQGSFLAQQQNRPAPLHPMHRQHASIAHLGGNGIGLGMPMTPGGGMLQQQQQQQFAAMMAAGLHTGQPSPGGLGVPPFVPRSKRTISIGGPPKAVLGGPNRKPSPLPPTPAAESAPALPEVKKKKSTVKFPLESDPAPTDEENAELDGRIKSLWSRSPIAASDLPPEPPVDQGLETTSVQPHPEHAVRSDLPNSIEVFLPGKVCEDTFLITIDVLRLFYGYSMPGTRCDRKSSRKNWQGSVSNVEVAHHI